MSAPDPFRPADHEAASNRAFVHDINNALEALLGLLHLLAQDKTLNGKSREHLTLAQQEARRAAELARVAMDRAQDIARPVDADVADLVRSVLDFYRSRLESLGIVIDVQCCADAHLSVYPRKLRHAVSNLVLNAADAMPEGGRLAVRVARAHEWSGQARYGLRLTVADSGCGIAATDLNIARFLYDQRRGWKRDRTLYR